VIGQLVLLDSVRVNEEQRVEDARLPQLELGNAQANLAAQYARQ
jgi:hypothetical protein